jgi:hypothetical protein
MKIPRPINKTLDALEGIGCLPAALLITAASLALLVDLGSHSPLHLATIAACSALSLLAGYAWRDLRLTRLRDQVAQLQDLVAVHPHTQPPTTETTADTDTEHGDTAVLPVIKEPGG